VEENIKKRIAVVTGDLCIDWNLALFSVGQRKDRVSWWHDNHIAMYRQQGGAALLADLARKVAAGLMGENDVAWEVRSPTFPGELPLPGDGRFHQSYAVWSQFGKDGAWRVKEFLGLCRGVVGAAREWEMVEGDPPEADLVILDDAGLGFRDCPELWPMAVREKDCPAWILVKMSPPVAQGRLWEHLHKNCSERVIVVVSADDLRRTEVQISRELSWERTAQDLYWELTHNPRINALSRCAHVIISFGTAGAFLLSWTNAGKKGEAHNEGSFEGTLFFDPAIVEGMWNQAFPGEMIGYNSCLTAGIARQLMLNGPSPDLKKGIQSGLSTMRLLHQKGYVESGEAGQLGFPSSALAQMLAGSEQPFAAAAVPSPVRFLYGTEQVGQAEKEGGWSIVRDRYSGSLEKVAGDIVMLGVEKALNSVPLGQFGKLITADRREVESFRSIRSLIGEYSGQSLNKPLSIAVFGPPGSGKSFAVKQIAASVRPGEIVPLEFNLSQLGSIEDLYNAFHQVRDATLTGKMPLVFWDEFDSTFENRPLGWLRYFLAPMQDGAFQVGQIIHPIGRCIFVFAGGTCCKMENFATLLDERDFVQAKGPDFVSRLKGYIDILGPNQCTTNEGATDPYYLIRRAIVLRVILQMNVPQIFSKSGGVARPTIDRGVLRALLHISEYKHGVRSLESIISMSSLVGKKSFERSSLPPEAQLNLHVDGREFLALAQQLELEGDVLEKLAEAAHNLFCEGKKRDGWKLGQKDEGMKTHPLLIPYAELEEIYKVSNRATVRNIPAKLAAAGYVMVPARSDQVPFDFPGDDLEKLAKLEHDLWMMAKREQGFTPGEPGTENPMRNPYLVEWDRIPEEIREIDRDLIKGIPKILAKAGYAVVRLHKDK
jgi:hypothetical protein